MKANIQWPPIFRSGDAQVAGRPASGYRELCLWRPFGFAATFALALGLAACGGGSGGSDVAVSVVDASSTVINGINVPVDPGTAGRTSLAGIDANANGVRDDVERAVASFSGGSPQEFAAAMKAAADAQTWLSRGTLSESEAQQLVVKEIQIAQCLRAASTAERARAVADLLELQTFNTSARRAARRAILDQAGTFEITMSGAPTC